MTTNKGGAIQTYIDGWKENNLEKILSSLAKGCKIIESHGPTYNGIDQVKKWVEVWLKANGVVRRWDVASLYIIEGGAVFEWIFECFVDGKDYYLEGISVVVFENGKIKYLREYRSTKKPFDWDGFSIGG
jgi:hypothetical protein